MLQALIGADGNIVEDLALLRVRDGAVQRIAAEAAADRTDEDPLGIETLEQDRKSPVDLADDVFGSEVDFVEEQLPLGFRRGNADRDVLLLDTLRLQVDDEQRKSLGLSRNIGMRRGAGNHQRKIRTVGIGNKGLLST